MNFTHLHLHSEYSLLDGVTRIAELSAKLKEYNMTSCGLTDHGNMYGTFKFYNEMKHSEIKPILGCEIYVAPRTRFDKEAGIDNKYYHLTVLAQNLQGYKNLMKIVSIGFMEGFYYKPRVDWEVLEKYNEGLIVLSGCLSGILSKHFKLGQDKDAYTNAQKYSELFRDRFFVEIQRNGIDEQTEVNEKLLKLAKELNLPIVATCDTHYINKEDYQVQEIVWAISDGKTLDDPTHRVAPSNEFYLKSTEQMLELFHDLPDAIENTQKIVDMVEEYTITFGRVEPNFLDLPDGTTPKDYLRKLVYEGAKEKYPELTKEVIERIDYELEIIDDKGYNNYFLVVYDFVNFCVSHDIMVGARGSAVGTVVGYCLDIAGVDPLTWGLYFERFLNPGRDSPPDIDLDISDQRRGEVIKYAQEKYGEPNVRQIITFSKLQTRQAIRDVSRVMGVDLQIADKLSKLVKVEFGKTKPIDYMMEKDPEFAEIINSSEQLQEMSRIVKKLAGLARGVSTHACGVVVSPEPVDNFIPVQKDSKNEGVGMAQFEMMDLEYVGLLKLDFLGLKNLNIIDNAVHKIKKERDPKFNLRDIDVNDQNVYQMLRDGHTMGVFQLEGEGMTKALITIRPETPEDLCYLLAAYRPGPIEFIPEYAAVKKGEKEPHYILPDLEPILAVTNGVITYQEQVMKIATDLAGYTLSEADNMRRAMGKKKMEIMEAEKPKFIQGGIDKGYPKEGMEEIWELLLKFANYGFNKSHAAAYAMVSYYTAYLKYYYPLEYMAALLEADLENFNRIALDIQECNRLGIEVVQPDINKSGVYFTVEEGDFRRIRFGLGAIKNVGHEVVKNIVTERERDGEYDSLDDFIYRNIGGKLQQRVVEYLIMAGAMDTWGDRKALLSILPGIFEKLKKKKQTEANGQIDFFSTDGDSSTSKQLMRTPIPEIEGNLHEMLQWEKDLLGLYFSSHPLDDLQEFFAQKQVVHIQSIKEAKAGKLLVLGALISKVRRIATKKGEMMAFLTVEDKSGSIDAVVFPRVYEELKDVFEANKPILIAARVSERENDKSVIIEKAKFIDQDKFSSNFKGVIFKITKKHTKKQIELLKLYIKENQGETPVKILIQEGKELRTIDINNKITMTKEGRELLQSFS
ncbi:DNA polymerase III subunit alpha [Candidatus Dojkabacteria bacterium]|nr:DNA polymerase III subunit alpha [Candidatus Dojkabacteria bacterium]